MSTIEQLRACDALPDDLVTKLTNEHWLPVGTLKGEGPQQPETIVLVQRRRHSSCYPNFHGLFEAAQSLLPSPNRQAQQFSCCTLIRPDLVILNYYEIAAPGSEPKHRTAVLSHEAFHGRLTQIENPSLPEPTCWELFVAPRITETRAFGIHSATPLNPILDPAYNGGDYTLNGLSLVTATDRELLNAPTRPWTPPVREHHFSHAVAEAMLRQGNPQQGHAAPVYEDEVPVPAPPPVAAPYPWPPVAPYQAISDDSDSGLEN